MLKSGLKWFWDRFGSRSSGSTSSSSSSYDSSSDTIHNQDYRYDVFISFRGPDTRNSFVDHLCSHLLRKGIFVFKDDHSLQKGESISPQLLQAIQLSRLSIIVFSKNYASSTWCLDEMTAIAFCKQQSSQIVFPIFYDVDPSHVRHQNGVYENDFVSHRCKFQKDRDKVRGWERAMTDLANSAGWDVRDKPEFEQIQSIVQAVIKKLRHKFSWFVNDLIGIQPRVQELEDKLRLRSNSDDVQVLGIWGMNGIGKTTHAAVLFDKISHRFDASCFIEDVSKLYRDGGHTAVQKQIIHQTLRENIDMSNPIEISGIVENRLHSIKVLVVLDNVDELEQLENLAIKPKLLLKGSRMVITTTDEHILKAYEGDVLIHKLPLLNDADARELFCRKAFKCEDQSSNCAALIPEVLKYAQCLPLAIKVLGSFLCTRDADEWSDVLNRLEDSPDDKIMNVLEISVEGLQREEKQIFLHIACFFKGERVDYVKRILECCGLYPHIGISRLIEKSLITISDEEIHMHELLQELGKKMVRDQSPEEPGSWSRIWLHKNFLHALRAETGTEKVKAIVLNKKEEMSECIVDGLSRMKGLTLLILYHTRVSGRLEFLSDRLQYLLWHDYPFASLPPYFTASDIVELNMPNSHITHFWEGRKSCPNLKRIDLSNSKYLSETPDFSRIIKLERLDLSGCTSLSYVHSSIGLLKKLAFLNLRNCCNLVSIDFGYVGNMSSLRVLHLSGCSKLESTPDFTRATHLEYLDMDACTSLSTIHESIGVLSSLTFLSLRKCEELVSIPYDINFLVSLQTLDLYGSFNRMDPIPGQSYMSHLEYLDRTNPILRQAFSSHLVSLIFLDISYCNLKEVPDTIGELRCLERLNLEGNKFVSIPDSFSQLHCLAYLNLSHCPNLKSLPDLPIEGDKSGGKYFKTVSGSRDHRSGFYLLNSSNVSHDRLEFVGLEGFFHLIKEPCNFRCGFDLVLPWDMGFRPIFGETFLRNSIIRILRCVNTQKSALHFIFLLKVNTQKSALICDLIRGEIKPMDLYIFG
ncbi:TMV resistance protein N isoform X2 [Vigna radiata var. radiata]|uniref:TMV resistance protein N isoform X2 n=1 Tax=Vigna radiata var. radiata TaxID=3916 RepID=A0A1S3VUK5_VIGRR|nr:TMV resistance protein N isoform X2 [Vigna radiata var. radiata]